MRLHSDTLNIDRIAKIFYDARDAHMSPHAYIDFPTQHGSRSRAYAFEIRIGAYDKIDGERRSWRNTGSYGADTNEYAATYDEWGFFIEALFTADPDMIFGSYTGIDDYHERTRCTFMEQVPQPDPYPYLIVTKRKRWRDVTPSQWVESTFEPRTGTGYAGPDQAVFPRYTRTYGARK
jgi:hypothetical protein